MQHVTSLRGNRFPSKNTSIFEKGLRHRFIFLLDCFPEIEEDYGNKIIEIYEVLDRIKRFHMMIP